ncbi:hypothetical protein GFL72_19585 [Rhizobium leguminosarum bv. viciae]|uniref:hypothetical protein n=1 Tax=Rhizobium leguminosarum TaxID=384 RepID=UPI001440FCE7|nr:hypothetical protein [Rhizobium leguminosarum]NKK36823.1 hypothetical protein [Rhizobium leguminosarum bv. viciae]
MNRLTFDIEGRKQMHELPGGNIRCGDLVIYLRVPVAADCGVQHRSSVRHDQGSVRRDFDNPVVLDDRSRADTPRWRFE